MKANESKICFHFFLFLFYSGLFNELRRIFKKKNISPFQPPPRTSQWRSRSGQRLSHLRLGTDIATEILDNSKSLHEKLYWPSALQGPCEIAASLRFGDLTTDDVCLTPRDNATRTACRATTSKTGGADGPPGTKARNIALAPGPPNGSEDPTKGFPMKCFLIAAPSASALSALRSRQRLHLLKKSGSPRASSATIEAMAPRRPSLAIRPARPAGIRWSDMTIRQAPTLWFIRTTGGRTMAPPTPGKSTRPRLLAG